LGERERREERGGERERERGRESERVAEYSEKEVRKTETDRERVFFNKKLCFDVAVVRAS
jgi:hypothetical protein